MADLFTSEFLNFSIEIADDQFSAFLTIRGTDDFLCEQELLELIAKTGITYGFSQATQMIEEKGIKKLPNQPFPFAIGDLPKAPEIEFSPLIDADKCYKPNDDSLSKLKSMQRVQKGDPLAHLFVTKPSVVGKNIFGFEVTHEMYENQVINDYLGDNVAYSVERGQIIATASGYPYMDELPRMHVKSEFTVEGGLDSSFAERDFFGTIVVNGDVSDKVRLNIVGDLIVNGNIVDAEISVDGNITVSGTIKDCDNPGIIATGKIEFQAAENSKIVAGNIINFKKSIYFCKVLAENSITGDEETSSIVGGVCQSGENVEVSIIGNTGSIGTEVEICISPYTKERLYIISKQMLKLKEQNQTGNIEYIDLQEEQARYELRLEDKINQMIKNLENLPKHIIVYKKIFPGSYIRILKKSKHLTEEMNRVSFSIVNSELVADIF